MRLNQAARLSFAIAALSLMGLISCSQRQQSEWAVSGSRKTPSYGQLKRADFNRRAAEKFLPLFWREDSNKDGFLQPAELAVLWGYGDSEASHWVNAEQQFTPQFDQAYQAMLQPDAASRNPAEEQRHKLVLDELAQGRTTLIQTDT